MKFSKDDTLAVKGIAILMMYIHHQFLDGSRYKGYYVNFFSFSEGQVQYVAGFFKICVGMFVFLTAYGMTMSFNNKCKDYVLTRKQTLTTIANRYISLISGYFIIFIISQLYSWNGQRQFRIYGKEKSSIWYFFIDFFGLAKIFDTPTFNATWWYMSLAIVIILIMPLLYRWYGKDGILVVFASILLPRALGLEILDLTRWLLAITLGIYFADRNILVRLKQMYICKSKIINKIIKFCCATAILILLVLIRQSKIGPKFIDIWDCVIPAYVVYYCFEFVIDITFIRKILVLLGKHSMNMFLSHTFFRAIYFPDFIYSFKYAWLDTLVLIIITLILSIIIEFLKENLKYNKIIDNIKLKTTEYIMNQ